MKNVPQLSCPKCGLVDVPILAPSKDQIGAYCQSCGSWIKWMPQSDPKFHFGKYKDSLVVEVKDANYLKWLSENVKLSAHMRNAVNEQIKFLASDIKRGDKI